MKNNPNRFWLIVILLGWTFDFLFWKKALGINFILFVALCLGTGIYLLRADGLRFARRSSLLLFPIAFLAVMTFLRLEPMTVFLSISMTLFLMGVFAITYVGGNWIEYGIVEYLSGYLHLVGSAIARPLGFAAEVRRDQPEGGSKRSVLPAVRGVILALPVIAIFASLLTAADPIFANRFEKFVDLFNIDNLPEYIFRLVLILVVAYTIAGVYLHAAQKSDDLVREKPLFPAFLGFTETGIVLGSVILLFASFVVIQFQYFFGGQANIHLDGFTFSEYARRGFGELVAVAFFSLLLLLGLGAVTHRASMLQRRMFSGFGMVLVGLVIVMLVSAFQRLVLYESAYGFSRLRTYTHIFMIWLGILLVTVAILEMFNRERQLALSILLVSLGFVCSLGLVNVDSFIVQRNIEREVTGLVESAPDTTASRDPQAELDSQYFISLSDDAVPVLVRAFQDNSLPENVREKVGAALACRRYEREQNEGRLVWQSFHLSRVTADNAFASIANELDGYQVDDTEYPAKVILPDGEMFDCLQNSFD